MKLRIAALAVAALFTLTSAQAAKKLKTPKSANAKSGLQHHSRSSHKIDKHKPSSTNRKTAKAKRY